MSLTKNYYREEDLPRSGKKSFNLFPPLFKYHLTQTRDPVAAKRAEGSLLNILGIFL